jgi:hypothetical protein
MLGEKRAMLDEWEQDLELRTAALVEAQARGINLWDNRNELMEFVKLRQLLQDIKADCVIEAGRLATLVSEVSQVLENLGMPPILRIPRDPHTTSHVMEAYNSGHDP